MHLCVEATGPLPQRSTGESRRGRLRRQRRPAGNRVRHDWDDPPDAKPPPEPASRPRLPSGGTTTTVPAGRGSDEPEGAELGRLRLSTSRHGPMASSDRRRRTSRTCACGRRGRGSATSGPEARWSKWSGSELGGASGSGLGGATLTTARNDGTRKSRWPPTASPASSSAAADAACGRPAHSSVVARGPGLSRSDRRRGHLVAHSQPGNRAEGEGGPCGIFGPHGALPGVTRHVPRRRNRRAEWCTQDDLRLLVDGIDGAISVGSAPVQRRRATSRAVTTVSRNGRGPRAPYFSRACAERARRARGRAQAGAASMDDSSGQARRWRRHSTGCST